MSETSLAEDSLASPPISTWLPWYFTRRALSILTVPLFLLLLLGLLQSIWAGFVYVLAFARASGAVFGGIAAFVAACFWWIPAFTPAILFYSLLRNVPGIWLRRDVRMRTAGKFGVTIGVVILLVAIGDVVAFGNKYAIRWIADRDPCAAYKAGVTGSIPPKSDCFATVQVQAEGIVSARDLTCTDFVGFQNSQKLSVAYGYCEGVQAELEKDEPDIIVPPSDARHPMWWVLPEGLGQNPYIGLEQKLDGYCLSGDNRHQKLLDAFLSIAYQKTGQPRFGISSDDSKTDPWKKILDGEESSLSCSAYSASPEKTRQAIIDGYYLGSQALKVRLREGQTASLAWPPKSSPQAVRVEVDKNCVEDKNKQAKLRDALFVVMVEMAVKQK
jgi:hypothetical protein